jgi:hypothetical protein
VPNLGRWEGTTPQGGRVAFVVAYFKGKRVMAAPTLSCNKTQDPFYWQAPDLFTYSTAYDFGNVFAKTERTAAIRAGGRFSYAHGFSKRDFTGMLSGSSGSVTSEQIVGVNGCTFKKVRVRRVGAAYSNGVYAYVGTFLTAGTFHVFSGGGVINFDTPAWGGPPEPRITAELGIPAGLLACKASYDPGPLALNADGAFQFAGPFRDYTNAVGTLNLAGQFATTNTLIGTYSGALTVLNETACPLNGTWAATRTVAPQGSQLSYRAPKKAGRTTSTPKAKKCVRVGKTVAIAVSRTKYPAVIAHIEKAIREGWPSTLVLNRTGAKARRGRLLRDVPSRKAERLDRDEYPPAILRGRGRGLTKGSNPTGWKASVEYVPDTQNQGAGASQGNKMRRYCNGQRIKLTGF